jgi:hypothetical protein
MPQTLKSGASPHMDSHATKIEMFNGNRIGQVFIACALAVNGLAIYGIAIATLFLAVFWWKFPQNFYAIVFASVNTVAGAFTLIVWLCVVSLFSLLGGLILSKLIVPAIRDFKEIFWPTDTVHAMSDTMTVYSTNGKLTVHDHTEDKSVYHYKIDLTHPEQTLLPPSPLTLPGKCSLREVIQGFDLTLDSIFLGLGKGKEPIACTLEGFMHVAHDGPTGKGKTVLSYAELVMLLKLGVRVILCNPHFAPVDKKGRDWRPIGQAIEMQGLVELAPGVKIPGLMRKCSHIEQVLKWLSQKEINRRFDLQARGDYSYQPIYIFLDEWPVIVAERPNTSFYLSDILRRGRAVEVCVSANAQGFLIDDVELKGSARENFNTAYHLGGSVHSGAKLLDMPVKDINALLKAEQVSLGEGIALLCNNEACPQAKLVRLPYADNDFAYYLLGQAQNWQLPELRRTEKVSARYKDEEVVASKVASERTSVWRPQDESESDVHKPGQPLDAITGTVTLTPELHSKLLRVLDMDSQNKNQNEIISCVWLVEPDTRQGRAAKEELKLVRAAIASHAKKVLQAEMAGKNSNP